MRKDFDLAVKAVKAVDDTLLLAYAGLKAYTDASAEPRCWDLDSRVVFRHLGGDEN